MDQQVQLLVFLCLYHPSVIGWSVGNEIGYLSANPKVMEYVQTAVKRSKELDPERLAVYVSHSVNRQENDPVKYSDLIMYNTYGGWGENVKKVNQLHPGKPIFMSEYGNHLNDVNPNLAQIDAAKMMNDFRGKEYMLGASLWTFNDYRSFWKAGPTWTTPPSQNRTWGVVNVYREKKRPYYTFRREYAPVENLQVKVSENEAEIQVIPRGKLDIPAYPLHNYQVIWFTFDKAGNVIEGGNENLNTINPGDPIITKNISWNTNNDITGITVDLIDPQMYSRRDTTIYFEVPDAPEIIKINTSDNQARVVFTHVPNATEYKVLYGKNNPDQETITTINNFMDVIELDQFQEYQFSVVALNCAGESKPSNILKARTDEDELPPVIWKTIPYHDHFFIGYSVDRVDYLYDVQYGTNSGEYKKQLGFRNVGVVQIPDLKPGETYYYRIRNRKQWGFASEWTHEVKIALSKDNNEQPVNIKGVVSTDKGWLIRFNPVDKAIGYEVSYKEDGNDHWQKTFINKAIINYVLLKELKKDRSYEFKINAMVDLNEYQHVELNGNNKKNWQ